MILEIPMICLCQRTCICLSSILIMARSKWISFGAHQPAKSQAGTSQSSLASPRSSPADAKKFGLENVSFHLLDRSALRSTFPVCQHLVSCLHSHTHCLSSHPLQLRLRCPPGLVFLCSVSRPSPTRCRIHPLPERLTFGCSRSR